MSAVGCIFHADGREVLAEELQALGSPMRQLGPDAVWHWRAGPVGLLQCTLALYQDERSTAAVASPSPDTPIVLAADARLDNRDELLRSLDGVCTSADEDAQILAAAYVLWGASFVERAVGDFALVLWDARRRRLFCLRDHVGVRPLYYYQSSAGSFACASSIGALLGLRWIPRVVDPWRVADELAGVRDDHERTYYRGIRRLPPAHVLSLEPGRQVVLRRYWSLDPGRELRLRSDAEYEEAFRSVFYAAVRSRLRSNTPVSVALSGGLDSTSLACVARRCTAAPLLALSLVFDEIPACDERAYIEPVVRAAELESHLIAADRLSPLRDWPDPIEHYDEPPLLGNIHLRWALCRSARQHGSRVLLAGFDGDTAVSHGLAHLTDLAHTGRLARLACETLAVSYRFRAEPWRVVRPYVVSPLVPERARVAWRRRRGRARFGGSGVGLLHPELIRRLGWAPPKSPTRVPGLTHQRWAHYRDLVHASRSAVLEELAHTSGPVGVEIRCPFEDRRLVELALALPPEQKLRWGWTRRILRRALAREVPQVVRRRMTKTDLSQAFTRNFMRFDWDTCTDLLRRDEGLLGRFVEPRRLWDLWRHCSLHPGQPSCAKLLRLATLGDWLRRA